LPLCEQERVIVAAGVALPGLPAVILRAILHHEIAAKVHHSITAKLHRLVETPSGYVCEQMAFL